MHIHFFSEGLQVLHPKKRGSKEQRIREEKKRTAEQNPRMQMGLLQSAATFCLRHLLRTFWDSGAIIKEQLKRETPPPKPKTLCTSERKARIRANVRSGLYTVSDQQEFVWVPLNHPLIRILEFNAPEFGFSMESIPKPVPNFYKMNHAFVDGMITNIDARVEDLIEEDLVHCAHIYEENIGPWPDPPVNASHYEKLKLTNNDTTAEEVVGQQAITLRVRM